MTKRTNVYLPYLLIGVLAFILYGNTIKNDYSLDDIYVIQNNEQVQKGLSAIPEIFTSFYADLKGDDGTSMQYGYRPMVKATYALEYQIFGENPHINHLFNILYYLLTAIILFIVLKKLLMKHHLAFLLAVVVLWMVHPIHTEVVASLKNRDEMLSLLFSLLTLNFFIDFYDKGKLHFIPLAVLSFLMAYFSKPSAMVFLAVYPLAIYLFRDLNKKRLLIIAGITLAAIVIGYLTPLLVLSKTIRPVEFYENPMVGKGMIARVPAGLAILLFYLKQSFVSYPMSFYYGFNTFPIEGWFNWQVILSAGAHIALLVLAIKRFRTNKILAFGILYYLITISIYANIARPVMGIAADRFLFTPTIGFALIAAWLIFHFTKTPVLITNKAIKHSKYFSVLVIICIPFIAMTINRNNDWENHLSLTKSDIPHLKNSAKANYLYAHTLKHYYVGKKDMGNLSAENAILLMEKHFKKAVEIYPGYYESWNHLGELNMMVKKNFKEAKHCFEKAIEHNPDFKTPYTNLGYLYEMQMNNQEAIKMYEKSIEMDPQDIRTLSNLSNLYYKQNNRIKAFELNNLIIKLNPEIDLPYYNMGKFNLIDGDTLAAITQFEKAVQINPSNLRVLSNLASIHDQLGNTSKARHFMNLRDKARNKRN
ncbi:MAG: tetratricopeptide repeat protein [Bacteroidales bacterium]|nr:tetratricopeptide repeat protein [Bacteroidales bacterium]